MTLNLSTLSPILDRAAKSVLSGPDFDVFQRIFILAVQNGALRELDFIRDSTTSFNPYPARIALIAIEEGGAKSLDLLATAVVSCCKNCNVENDTEKLLLPKISAAAEKIRRIAEDLQEDEPRPSDGELMILKIQLLDRARHLHQATTEVVKRVLPKLRTTIESCLNSDLKTSSDPVGAKLAYWLEHRAPRLSQLN